MTCAACEDCPFDQTQQKEFHEVHVTVETNDSDRFFSVCEQNGIKAIVIEDLRKDGKTVSHLMTSQKIQGSEDEALKELHRIKNVLTKNNFGVIREKIETNPLIQRDYSIGYFETHLEFDVFDMKLFIELLGVLNLGILISTNQKKKNVTMATVREHNTNPTRFEQKVAKIVYKLAAYDYNPKRIITEYCYLDTNLAMDKGW